MAFEGDRSSTGFNVFRGTEQKQKGCCIFFVCPVSYIFVGKVAMQGYRIERGKERREKKKKKERNN